MEERLNALYTKNEGVELIRNKFKDHIPEGWTETTLRADIVHEVANIDGVTIHNMNIILENSGGKISGFYERVDGDALITHPDFVFINYAVHNLIMGMDSLYISLIYTKGTFEEFFEAHLKDSEVVETRPLKDGLYKLEKTPTGLKFVTIDSNEINPPVLSDSLGEKLLGEIENFKNNKELYDIHKLEYKRGLLLYGPPGNGKTSFLKSFFHKHEAITVFVDISSYEEIELIKKVLTSEHYVDRLKVIVFEDIDSMGKGMRSCVLNLLDGVERIEKTVFIATTNFPHNLDAAIIKRPSRFDSLYEIGEPSDDARAEIFKRFVPDIDDVELATIVKETAGLSGAFLKEVFIFARINGITLVESAKDIKKRTKKMTSFSSDVSYCS